MKPVVIAAAALAALAMPAAAQEAEMSPEGMRQMMAQYDANGDKAIDQAEYQAMLDSRFAALDGNGDGTLSKEEFAAKSAEIFGRLDRNGDGKISREDRRG
jgi:Ca2+-binding EF-hand superfamily protein